MEQAQSGDGAAGMSLAALLTIKLSFVHVHRFP